MKPWHLAIRINHATRSVQQSLFKVGAIHCRSWLYWRDAHSEGGIFKQALTRAYCQQAGPGSTNKCQRLTIQCGRPATAVESNIAHIQLAEYKIPDGFMIILLVFLVEMHLRQCKPRVRLHPQPPTTLVSVVWDTSCASREIETGRASTNASKNTLAYEKLYHNKTPT